MIADMFGGMIIVESPLMVDHHAEQYKFPRSKKRRIRKKFAKKYVRRWSTPMQEVYQVGSRIICHPEIAHLIRRQTTMRQ